MPFININGAEIHYQTFGRAQPGNFPLVLIHGSTQTGYSCWNKVAPLLAGEGYQVLVPDCRGHGNSSNPNMSYSFKELADDLAAFIRAMGYEKAHLIGHSNGGNVVLVTLLEHPEVVQTCIAQAANAWVSPDLVEKEPGIFDSDFIQQQRPLWMQEMIELHAPRHGEAYWRKLVQLTVDEIIHAPNYSADDLAQVARPTLVIQGEHDHVNAPFKHAQFIARHIPASDLWLPAGVGHNVHDEVLNAWMERVTHFLARRGTALNEKLHGYCLKAYPDSRTMVCDPYLDSHGSLCGTVLDAAMRQEVLNVLATAPKEDRLRVLITPDSPWALLKRPLEDLRRQPSILSERVSQVRMGEVMRVMECQAEGDWCRVRLEADSYMGWVHTAALHLCAEKEVQSHQAGLNAIICVPLAVAYDHDQLPVQKIPFATLVHVIKTVGQDAWLQVPGGDTWKISCQDFLPLERRPAPDLKGIRQTLGLVRGFAGVPYLWGGRTPYGFDCSGLAGTFYAFMGILIPRDADQQYEAGMLVEGSPLAGDLLFFGEPDEDGRIHISHVGISLGGDEFIHSNGADWGISINTLNPDGKRFRKWLLENYRGARRFR